MIIIFSIIIINFFQEYIKPLHRVKLESWLNKNMKIKMSDNRTIIGIFLCTDCHRNIILGSSLEFLKDGTLCSID